MNDINLVKKNIDDEKKKKSVFYILMHRDNNGRKAFFLIVLFLLTIILLGTSTYAWFTANYTVSVTKLDVTVASGSGIQISTDAINWKSMVNSPELLAASTTYPTAVNQVPTQTNSGTTLSPVSTVKAVTGITGNTVDDVKTVNGLKMFLGNVTSNTNGDYILSTTQQTDTHGTTGHYLAFDVFIKSDFSAATTLYLTKSTAVHGYTTGGGTDTDIEYASRMAIINEGNTSSSSTTATMQNLNAGASAIFVEPNYDVHTATGVTHASNVYNITTYVGTEEYNEGESASEEYQPAIEYDGVKAAIATDAADYTTSLATGVKWGEANKDNYPSYFDDVEIDIPIASDNDTSTTGERKQLMTLQPGVTKLRLYMWIEGQDVDCENNASGGTVLFNIGFEVDEPSA